MSVSFAKAVRDGCRNLGVEVNEVDGCYSRGNGQTSDYRGIVNHHTAGGFTIGFDRILVDGWWDLPGPLCNTALDRNGRLWLIAAHPANHAGASGGWDTAPLPHTGLFNKLTWGCEIQYPGVVPMTDAQYRSALIQSHVVCKVAGVPGDYRWVKFHQGTSVQGKWDPGYAEGRTYDIARFRDDIRRLDLGADDGGPLWQQIFDEITGGA